MATSLETFLPRIRPHVSACPDAVMRHHVLLACRRFCHDTTIIRQYINSGDIVQGADDYTITPDTGTEVVRVINLLYKESNLPAVTEEWLDRHDEGWRTADPGEATAYHQPTPYRIRLNRIPNETVTDGLIPRAAVKPSLDATTVDDILYEDWFEAIRHGAISTLMEIPQKEWSDINLSIHHGKHFNFHIQRAKHEATKNFAKISTSVKMRSWI